jgi:hypothetical protein
VVAAERGQVERFRSCFVRGVVILLVSLRLVLGLRWWCGCGGELELACGCVWWRGSGLEGQVGGLELMLMLIIIVISLTSVSRQLY